VPPPLSAAQVNALTELITDVFDPPELQVLTRLRLGQHLYNLVDTAQPFPHVVLALIGAVEGRGWTEEFIRVVYEERKDKDEVRLFCETHAPFVFTPRTANAVLTDDVRTALRAAAGQVRGVVAETVSALTSLSRQFTVLHRYKVLHDCLHQLDFVYAGMIERDLPALAVRPEAADNLAILLDQMADILKRTRPAITGLDSEAAERIWLDVGEEAVGRMLAGVSDRNAAAAEVGFQMLRGPLRVQPTRINELLTGVLERLALGALRGTLDNLRPPDRTAEADDPLDRAVAALGTLAIRLNRVLVSHKEWQLVDNGMRQIEIDFKFGSPPAAEQFLWAEVARRLGTVLDGDREAGWSKEVRKLADALTQAFATGEPEPVRVAFGRLRPRARWYFFQADKDLKALAEDLDRIGEVLLSILQGGRL
jgi:hypothetical protein